MRQLGGAEHQRKCVQRCGLQVDELMLSSLASSTAVLTATKGTGRRVGGHGPGTTDIAVFVQGAICHSQPAGGHGDKVTEDIAHMLRTPTPHAEDIKVKYACALAQMARRESIRWKAWATARRATLPRHALAGGAGPLRGIFEMVRAELRRSANSGCAGLVLTGGAAKMEGVVELAEEMLQMPVRIGIPQHVGGLGEVVGNPVHATGVDLLLMGARSSSPKRPSLPPARWGQRGQGSSNGFGGEF